MNAPTETAVPTSTSTQSGRELAVGLAGLGRFGTLHASILGRMPNVRLVAVCDPVAAKVSAIADALGVPGRFGDYERMLEETALDAVVVVTPEPLHAGQVMTAVERELPVFVEKPLATGWAEGRRVAEAAREAGVPIQVGLVLRFDVQHAGLKQAVAAGTFGDLVSLRVKRNISRSWFPLYGDRAHPVYETSIHDIDLLLWLTGSRCDKVYAVQRSRSGLHYPDACFALLQFASGAVATLETSWFIPDGAPANVVTETWHGTIDAELEVVGTERTAAIRLLESGSSVWSPQRTSRPEAALWPELHGQTAGALREEVGHFLDCVRTGTRSPVASVDDAVEGLRIAEAIIASAESGREVMVGRG